MLVHPNFFSLAVVVALLTLTVAGRLDPQASRHGSFRRHHDLATDRNFSWYEPDIEPARLLNARQASGGGNPGASQILSNSTNLAPGECTAQQPCVNGACCDGQFCGYGPDYCTPTANGGKCLSNCNAVAECGQYAAVPGQQCPLNVCCSQYGFCGTTDEFCGAKCQSNCGYPAEQSCDPSQSTSTQRRVGYYQTWATDPSSRACKVFPASEIPIEALTHLNWAFLAFNSDFTVLNPGSLGVEFLVENTRLRDRNPNAKMIMSIGGWSFNDPPTQNLFSDSVSSQDNINKFVQSIRQMSDYWQFDGVDIDWEYPVAPERGGSPNDYAGLVNLIATLRNVLGPNKVITMTLPSSYWYLRHFDLPNLVKSVDFFNLMTYDLHGVWDAIDPYVGSYVLAHTNLTEIKQTIQLFDRVGIDHGKIALGYGFYGRSFTLRDPSCTDPGCPFAGGGTPGSCSLDSGTLMYSEIEDIITSTGASPIFDETDAVMYLIFNGDQWVSYDNADTFGMKRQWANENCIGGSMIWSVDQDDEQFSALQGLFPDLSIQVGKATSEPNSWIFSTANIAGTTEEDKQEDENESNEWATDPAEGGSSGPGSYNPGGHEAFGDIFISSPQASAVSSMAFVSDWVITNCTRNSKEPQHVLAYCKKAAGNPDRGCDHLFHGEVEHTIVRMPKTCGGSPYARIASFQPTTLEALPSHHQGLIPEGENPYSMKFDYNYAAIPASNGPVYMRADLSNDAEYYDKIINEASGSAFRRRNNRRRAKARFGTRHHKRNFHDDPTHPMNRRWWGAFADWLSRLNRVESEHTTSQRVSYGQSFTLYDASESCSSGNTTLASSLKITADATVHAETQYGYYLQATVVPPSILQSYAYFSASPALLLAVNAEGTASATFDSTPITLLTIGFPGLSYPGLVEIGPSMKIGAYASGSFAAQGQFSSTFYHTVPQVYFALGRSSSSDSIGSTQDTSSPISAQSSAANVLPGYYTNDAAISGSFAADLQVHVVPSLQMGITILGGSVLDGGVYVQADAYAGFGASASAGSTSVTQACVTNTYGLDVSTGYTGSLLSGSVGDSVSLYSRSNTYTYGSSTCMPISHQPSRRSLSNSSDFDVLDTGLAPHSGSIQHGPPLKRSSVPYLPGDLFCPSGSGGTGGGSCDPLRGVDLSQYRKRTDLEQDEEDELELFVDLFSRGTPAPSKIGSCSNAEIPKIAYNRVPSNLWCDFANPTQVDGAVQCGSDPPMRSNDPINFPVTASYGGLVVYHREHVYETSTIAAFITSLSGSAYQNGALYSGDFCAFVGKYVTQPFGTSSRSLARQLAECLPYNNDGRRDAFGQEKLMPMLAALTNVYKYNFLAGSNVGDNPDTNDCPHAQTGGARAARAVVNYLNQPTVRMEFQRASSCIKQTLGQWFTTYASATGPSMTAAQLQQAYSKFIQARVSSIPSLVTTSINDNFANNFANINSGTNQVIVSYEAAWRLDGDEKDRPLAVYYSIRDKTVQDVTTSQISALGQSVPAIVWSATL